MNDRGGIDEGIGMVVRTRIYFAEGTGFKQHSLKFSLPSVRPPSSISILA